MRRVFLASLLATALLGAAGPAEARRAVPSGFFGAVLDGPLNNPTFAMRNETSVMSRSGVESVRFVAEWRSAQPYGSFAEVPSGQSGSYRDEGGVPTDWTRIDRYVGEASRRGLRSIVTLLNPPPWARVYPDRRGSPPQPEPFARFAQALVRRYGPRGRFWVEYPRIRRVPVRYWQLLNEVNHTSFWSTPGSDPANIDNTDSAPGYVSLLRTTRAAIKQADRRARIIHAGIDSRSWKYAEAVYRAGGRRLFDAFAVHPFTNSPENVLLILRYVRRAMNRARDRRKPIFVTEWAFPSARGQAPDPGGLSTTRSGQARRVGQTHRIFVRWRKRLRLHSVFHYSWMGDEDPGDRFSFAGLRAFVDRRVSRKPALTAYARSALRYEGCRRKSSRLATRCLRRRR